MILPFLHKLHHLKESQQLIVSVWILMDLRVSVTRSVLCCTTPALTRPRTREEGLSLKNMSEGSLKRIVNLIIPNYHFIV